MQKRIEIKSESWLPRIAELCRQAGEFGFDIESTALPEWKGDKRAGLDPWKSQIRSFQISTREYSWFIDLFKIKDVTAIIQLLSDPDIVKAIHNASYEQSMIMHKFGVVIENLFCTMIASRLLAPKGWIGGGGFRGHGLADAMRFHCHREISKDEQKSDWGGELTESQISYAHIDAEAALELYYVLKEKLENVGMTRCSEIEFDAVLGFSDLYLNGLDVDMKVIDHIGDVLQGRIAGLYRYLASELPSNNYGFFYDEAVKLSSREQLYDAFFKKTGIKLLIEDKETGEDKISTAAGTLLEYRGEHPKLVDALIDHSSLNHIYDTYCKDFKGYIHPITGKVHPDYAQIGQWQHRPSANKPNALNVPRGSTFGPGVNAAIFKETYWNPISFRDAFFAPDGYKIVKTDFATNQFRILADFSRDQVLLDEFAKPDANPYKRLAGEFLGIPVLDVTPEQRQSAKTLVLAFCFGAGAKKHQITTLEQSRVPITFEKAEQDRDRFFRVLKGLGKWIKAQPPMAEERRYTEARSGRKVFFPRDARPYSDCINYPITTTEVDGAKLSLGRVAREIRQNNWNAKLIMHPYDEIVCCVADNQASEWAEVQSKIMKESMDEFMVTVPSMTETNIYQTWGSKDRIIL
jgi:DNA polymerase I